MSLADMFCSLRSNSNDLGIRNEEVINKRLVCRKFNARISIIYNSTRVIIPLNFRDVIILDWPMNCRNNSDSFVVNVTSDLLINDWVTLVHAIKANNIKLLSRHAVITRAVLDQRATVYII